MDPYEDSGIELTFEELFLTLLWAKSNYRGHFKYSDDWPGDFWQVTSGTSVRENYITSYKLFREDYEPMPFNHCYDIGYYIPEWHSYSMKCFFCALYMGKVGFEQKRERGQLLSTDNTFEVCAFGPGGWMEQAIRLYIISDQYFEKFEDWIHSWGNQPPVADFP